MDLPARAAHGQERVCARAREDSETHEKRFRVWDGELQQTLEAAAEGGARGAPLVRCGSFVRGGRGEAGSEVLDGPEDDFALPRCLREDVVAVEGEAVDVV